MLHKIGSWSIKTDIKSGFRITYIHNLCIANILWIYVYDPRHLCKTQKFCKISIPDINSLKELQHEWGKEFVFMYKFGSIMCLGSYVQVGKPLSSFKN